MVDVEINISAITRRKKKTDVSNYKGLKLLTMHRQKQVHILTHYGAPEFINIYQFFASFVLVCFSKASGKY